MRNAPQSNYFTSNKNESFKIDAPSALGSYVTRHGFSLLLYPKDYENRPLNKANQTKQPVDICFLISNLHTPKVKEHTLQDMLLSSIITCKRQPQFTQRSK